MENEYRFVLVAQYTILARFTKYYNFFLSSKCGRLKKEKNILIHSGAGDVGQAAINISLHYGCEVFTTVGTQIEHQFIKKTYPGLKGLHFTHTNILLILLFLDEHIGYSQGESFKQMVLEETNGRGVDIVLNSVTEDKLIASTRCLASGGMFIEMGKFNMKSNHCLNLLLFKKQTSFHNVALDETLNGSARCEIRRLFRKLMEEGAVKPLERNVYRRDEIEEAFRFMAAGEHIGKVLIKLREPETELVAPPSTQKLCSVSR